MPVEQIGVRSPAAKRRLAKVSLILRRTHMYVALFLTPWMTMYALSTVVFNHFGWFGGQERFERERLVAYPRPVDEDADPDEVGAQIRRDLGIRGRLALRDSDDDTLTFVETDNYRAHRITYSYSRKNLVIEKQEFRTANFLTYLHSRVGYGRSHASIAWAASVDLTIAATLVWLISGSWMWWELKVTRRWGSLFALGGPALFVFIWWLG